MGATATFGSIGRRLGYYSPLWTGLVPGLLALGGLALIDAREGLIVGGFFAAVPLATALSGQVRVTIVIAVLALALGAASGIWNDNLGATVYWVRIGLWAGASAFSIFVATVIAGSNRTARRLELLNEISESGDTRPSLASALERITSIAVPEVADICVIDAISGGRMERLAVRASGEGSAEIERFLSEREPTVQRDVAFGRDGDEAPILVKHVSDYDLQQHAADEQELAMLRRIGTRSYVVVALRSRGRRIGTLSLTQAWSGRRHNEEDVRFSQLLADRIALTLDNAGLFSDLESVEMRMDSVMGVLDEPVTITERGGRLIFANAAAVALADRDSLDELLDTEPGDVDFDIYDEEGRLLGEGMFPWQLPGLERGQIVRMVHAGHGEETWLRVRSRSIPVVDDRPMYTVTAFEDVSEMKLSEFVQSVFASTGELLATLTDPHEMLTRLVRLLTPRMADSCAVLMPAGDGAFELAALADSDPDRQRLIAAAIQQNPLHREAPGMPEMLASREAILYDTADPSGWPKAAVPLAAGLEALGLGAVMGQPLRIGDRLIGIIGFANNADRRPFTALEKRIAMGISERVALAVDNARIASERAEIAETLQSGLRPGAIPEIPGWSLSALYSPAGIENRAGGDFYDLLRIEGGWMVVIGDVTGHGARAASLTALARYTLRAAASMTGDPQRALAELNDALLKRPGAALCSVAAFTLDQPAGGVVRVAVAGHPPPLLIRGGETREIQPPGPILGAFEDSRWELETLELEPTDKLLVYTDGVVEAKGRSGRFGEERLSRCVSGSVDPGETIERIRAELAEFAAGELRDDAAALAVMFDRPGSEAASASGAGADRTTAGVGVSAS